MKLLLFIFFFLLSTIILGNELHSFAHTSQDGNLLVSFELDESAKLSHFALENPFRIVLEMQDVQKGEKIKELEEIKNSPLKQIITVPYKRNGVSNLKILIHLDKKSDYEVDVFGNRVLLNVKNVGDSQLLVAKNEPIKNSEKNSLKTDSNQKKIETLNSEPENKLSKIEYQYQGDDLLIAIQSKEERAVKSFHLMNPFRIVVDFPDTAKDDSILNEINYSDTFLEKAVLSTYKRDGKTGTKLIFSFKDEKTFQAESIGATYIITVKNARETQVAKNSTISEKQTPKKNENSEKTESDIKKENNSSITEKNSTFTENNNTINSISSKLEKIDYQYQGEDLLIALQTDDEKEAKHFYLVDPFRVVVEFQNTTKNSSIPNELNYQDGYLEKLITSSFRKNGQEGVKLIFYFKEAKPFQLEQMGTTTLLTLKGIKIPQFVAKKDEKSDNLKDKSLSNKSEKINNLSDEKKLDGNYLSKIDYQYQDEDLLIALSMNEEREVKHFHLIDPFRVVVDIPDTSKADSIKNEIKYNDPYFEKIMASTYRRNGKNGVKIIFYFKEERPFLVENIGNRVILTARGAKPKIFIAKNDEIKKETIVVENKKEKKENKISKIDEKKEIVAEKYSNDLESIQFDHSGDDLILMVQIKDPTKFKHFHLTDPFRIFLELEGVVLGKNFTKNISHDFIEDVSTIPFIKNGVDGLKVMLHFKENKPFEVDSIGNRVLITIRNIPKKEILVSKNSETTKNSNDKLKSIADSQKNISKTSVSGNVLDSIKHEYTKDTMIFAIKCSEECKSENFHLISPFRVFVNISNITISPTLPEEISYNDPFIEKVTVTPFNRNGVKGARVVFHFKQEKSYLVESIGSNTLLSLFGTSGEAIALKKDIDIFDMNESDSETITTNKTENNSTKQEKINSNLTKENQNDSVALKSDSSDKNLSKTKSDKDISPKYVTITEKEQKKQLSSKDLHSSSQKGNYYTVSTSTYTGNSMVSIAKNENSVFSSDKKRDLGEAPSVENINNSGNSSSSIFLKSGFRKYEDSSRVTISIDGNPKMETTWDKKVLKITLKNSSFSPKASRFPLNTSYFDSNVQRVVPIQSGDDLVIQIYLKETQEPDIAQGEGVIYIDFKE